MAPSASRFTAVPTTIWSTRPHHREGGEERADARGPAPAAAATPASAEPEATATTKPAKAPVSMVPSIPMSIRPARSITQLAERGEQQRGRQTQRGLEQRLHLSRPPSGRGAGSRPPGRRRIETPTASRITTPCTTCVTTAGTPASRCIAAAPASSAPKKSADGITQSGCKRASSATAIAV